MKDIHYTDVLYEIYKRMRKAEKIIKGYSKFKSHSPLLPKSCELCTERIKGEHSINKFNKCLCNKCYCEQVILYHELNSILSKFKGKE